MKDLEFLKKYINTPSPSGFEHEAQEVWAEHMAPLSDEIITDVYGNVCAVIRPKHESEYKVMIEAHADEVSWSVNMIDNSGFVWVKKNGGADEMIAPSMRVWIHTKKGKVPAVFGWPAVHVRNKDKKAELTSLYLDLGVSSKSSVEKLGVEIGNPITYQDEFYEVGFSIMGRGMDNKIGGYILSQVARKIRENNIELPYSLFIANSVQEEVGQRGSQMISNLIKPDVAIVTDVCHDTNTPHIAKTQYGDISSNKGPVISHAPSVNRPLNTLIQKVSKDKRINLQEKVCSAKTGTDLESISYTGTGIPAALISVPTKYMHTSVEMLRKGDIEDTINLIIGVLQNINEGDKFKIKIGKFN